MNHNREKQFYEMRAKLTLERLPELGYGPLEMSEMPDLLTHDRECGIEITRAISNHDAEQTSIFQKHFEKKNIHEISQQKIDRFCKDGTRLIVTGDFGISPSDTICGYAPEARWFNTRPVKNAIKRKLIHINEVQYQTTDKLALYVFTPMFKDYSMNEVKEVLTHIYPCQDICPKSFDTIYIDDCGWFYECDMRRKRVRFFDTQSILRRINEDAKAFVDKK